MDYNLSPEQMQKVRECWKTLLERKDGLEAGMLMFVRLFEVQPNLHSYFKFDLDGQSLELKLHVRAVIATLDKCIKNMDDWNNVEENFEQLGMMHSMLGVSKDQLQTLVESFQWMMEKCLENYFTDERREACQIFMKRVAGTMGKNL
eukprot:Seg2281.6 transcript_id=Seg2281.6/GoldUCD/mRNA.D3Y31 product=Neuroglobin protein_id=Seg2281.6/GoldUCD/D3Y31